MTDFRADDPRPNSLEARDKASVVHGLTNLRRHMEAGPKVIESGRGVMVRDVEGKEYIEVVRAPVWRRRRRLCGSDSGPRVCE